MGLLGSLGDFPSNMDPAYRLGKVAEDLECGMGRSGNAGCRVANKGSFAARSNLIDDGRQCWPANSVGIDMVLMWC